MGIARKGERLLLTLGKGSEAFPKGREISLKGKEALEPIGRWAAANSLFFIKA